MRDGIKAPWCPGSWGGSILSRTSQIRSPAGVSPSPSPCHPWGVRWGPGLSPASALDPTGKSWSCPGKPSPSCPYGRPSKPGPCFLVSKPRPMSPAHGWRWGHPPQPGHHLAVPSQRQGPPPHPPPRCPQTPSHVTSPHPGPPVLVPTAPCRGHQTTRDGIQTQPSTGSPKSPPPPNATTVTLCPPPEQVTPGHAKLPSAPGHLIAPKGPRHPPKPPPPPALRCRHRRHRRPLAAAGVLAVTSSHRRPGDTAPRSGDTGDGGSRSSRGCSSTVGTAPGISCTWGKSLR